MNGLTDEQIEWTDRKNVYVQTDEHTDGKDIWTA